MYSESNCNFWKHTDDAVPPMFVEVMTILSDITNDVPICGYRSNIIGDNVFFISEESPKEWVAKYWKFKNDYDSKIYKIFKGIKQQEGVK